MSPWTLYFSCVYQLLFQDQVLVSIFSFFIMAMTKIPTFLSLINPWTTQTLESNIMTFPVLYSTFVKHKCESTVTLYLFTIWLFNLTCLFFPSNISISTISVNIPSEIACHSVPKGCISLGHHTQFGHWLIQTAHLGKNMHFLHVVIQNLHYFLSKFPKLIYLSKWVGDSPSIKVSNLRTCLNLMRFIKLLITYGAPELICTSLMDQNSW